MKLFVFVLALIGSVCGRLELLWHLARFHDCGKAYCEGDEECVGHLVCHDCEVLLWHLAADPWRFAVDDDDQIF